MSKTLKTVLIIVGIVIVLAAMFVKPYNKMVQRTRKPPRLGLMWRTPTNVV